MRWTDRNHERSLPGNRGSTNVLDWPELNSYEYVEAYRSAAGNGELRETVNLSTGHRLAFEIAEGIATSILPLTAAVAEGRRAREEAATISLDEVRRSLNVDALHFRQLFAEDPETRRLVAVRGAKTFRRRDSVGIDWHARGQNLWPLVVSRIGSLARRRKRTFEQLGYSCRFVRDVEYAISCVRRVERHSWKHLAHRSLEKKGQLPLFSALISRGVIRIHGAFDGDIPIAYRADAISQDVVYCIEYSFDEEYGKSSPGFYLAVCDLPTIYGKISLSRIDLYGGIDQLKEVVGTHFYPRVDLYFGDERLTEMLVAQASAYDQKMRQLHEARRSVRAMVEAPSTLRNHNGEPPAM